MQNQDQSLKIGAKLRHARLLMGISLAELGEKIGVTEGYLSKLENDRSQASMATLHKLVQALGSNMSELFATPAEDHGPVLVVRQNERARLVTGHRRAGNQVTLEKLVPSGPGYLLQINIHVVAAGGGSSEPISHMGQEFGYVLAGTLELTVDGHPVVLHEGDSFYFESPLPHSYQNLGDGEARILWVNTPPTF
ncbi:cupin domain-containing protein (plasmid) [Rhizobium sp. CB3060]|uniref:cupin domain-containing protein n=1 Tax=Rhizobium sp. CB3060 TaxID=3138255 RepID=UPI0021A5FE1D|nr:cupin domain-containing protein [Rhizobium tropici]UWU25529.1 cupin domain-containing protein [Rhizobium tropici]